MVSTVLWHPVCGLCCGQAAVFFQYLVGHSAQCRLQEESVGKAIDNNSAADSHIFLLRHSPFLVCSMFTLHNYSKILNSWIGFRSNRMVTNYLI